MQVCAVRPATPTSDKDAAYKRIQRRVFARHARNVLALGIFALAACADDAGSARKDDNGKAEIVLTGSDSASGFVISRFDGLPDDKASELTKLLSEEATARQIPFNTTQGPAFAIHGAVGAGPNAMGIYVVTIIDVIDPKGTRLHRFMNETVLPETSAWSATDPWAAVSHDDLKKIASAAAGKLAGWYDARERHDASLIAVAEAAASISDSNDMLMGDSIITGSIDPAPLRATSAPALAEPRLARNILPYEINVSPAPGDGDRALTEALNESLAKRLKPDSLQSPLRVIGDVTTASRTDGRTDVAIRWRVTTLDGRLVGTVTQTNAMSPGRIAGRWGEVARDAAESAADGLVALLSPEADRS